MGRAIGHFNLNPIGFGAMGLSHVYGGRPSKRDAVKLLHAVLDAGCNHIDTAALYGYGANETLIGETLNRRRKDYMLASKCGMTGVDGKKKIDGRPDTLRKTIEDALRRLRTEVIDLYYLHRWDKSVPIEDSVGEMSRFVDEGKIKYIGLSEVSEATLRKAHAVHPITAVQSEYSLWTRNPEIAVLQACKEMSIAFVAFSPLARAFLTRKFEAGFNAETADLRHKMPRFQTGNWTENFALLRAYLDICRTYSISPEQAALAWVLAQGDNVHVIPGTTKPDHLRENMGAGEIPVDPEFFYKVSNLINQKTVFGPRYSAAVQKEIDTEEFA